MQRGGHRRSLEPFADPSLEAVQFAEQSLELVLVRDEPEATDARIVRIEKENTLTTIQVVGTGPSNFAESGIEITVAGDTKPGAQWGMLREYRKRIRYAFDKEGIEIPFPQRTVWLQNESAKWPGRQTQ